MVTSSKISRKHSRREQTGESYTCRGNSVRNFIRKITKCDKLTRKARNYSNQDEGKENKYEKTELKFLHSSNNTLSQKYWQKFQVFIFFRNEMAKFSPRSFSPSGFSKLGNYWSSSFLFFLLALNIHNIYDEGLQFLLELLKLLQKIIFPDYWIYQIVKR